VITITMSTRVSADRDRVWRALTVPEEILRWDEQLVALLDSADGYPLAGQQVRWRYRLGTIAVMLRNSLLEVVPKERLRSATAMGLFRFDETFTLGHEIADPERTRLQLKLIAAWTSSTGSCARSRGGVRITPEARSFAATERARAG
jgi:uncharacterized protein YndB with AHSA1/START domain